MGQNFGNVFAVASSFESLVKLQSGFQLAFSYLKAQLGLEDLIPGWQVGLVFGVKSPPHVGLSTGLVLNISAIDSWNPPK